MSYVKPEMKIVEIDSQAILAGSYNSISESNSVTDVHSVSNVRMESNSYSNFGSDLWSDM